MLKAINPTGIAEPYGNAYSHAIEVPAGARMLYISGQVGMAKDGSVAKGMAAQSEQVWLNILTILRDAGMTVNNIVKMNAYLRSFDDFAAYAAVRKRYLAGHKPAALGVAVAGLIDEFLVEVDVVAAAM